MPNSTSPQRRLLTLVVVIAVLFAGLLGMQVAQAVSPDLVVSQVYGGGGNSGAMLRNDFVELFNRGTAPADVSGWSVQYAAAGGGNWNVTGLNGTVAPGRYYLVQQAQGAGGTVDLPPPDAIGTAAMSATSGKVALVTNQTALTCGATAGDCLPNPAIRDFVGYGSAANSFEGAGPTATLSNTTAALRTASGCTDGDDNAGDFATGAPDPRNSASPANACDDTPTPTPTPPGTSARIRDIQGAAHVSPLNGSSVSNVPGVVTAKRANGFYLQDPVPDRDEATSEAIFVFTSLAPAVAIGDSLRVSGRVGEFRPGGSGGVNNLSITQIGSPSITVLSRGNDLPAATVIGLGGRIPPAIVIEDDASGDLETSGDFDPDSDGIDFYESLEGMLVQVNSAVAVGPRSRFGEIAVLADNGANAGVRTARGGIIVRPEDFNPERIIVDDEILSLDGQSTPPVNVRDHFPDPIVGVIDYSFGNFKLQATRPFAATSGGLTREVTAPADRLQLAFATFNVENLDPADGAEKFDALATLIVANLQSPDLIALEEIQDNNGPVNDDVVDADATYNALIAAIEAAGGPTYRFLQVNPVDDADGGEPGGNIRVGFLFRTDRGLAPVDRPGGGPTTPTEVVSGANGPELSVSPGRIDPTNPAFGFSRKPLVGEFSYGGRTFFVIANHFNSKLGDQPLFGRFQPPVRSTEVQRREQARIVNDFVGRILAVDAAANVVVLGDFNDFEFSEALSVLKGDVLYDLADTLPKNERYSYVFDGNSQLLDHILVSRNLFNNTTPLDYDIVHVNAEFFDQISDHDPQVARFRLKNRPTRPPPEPSAIPTLAPAPAPARKD